MHTRTMDLEKHALTITDENSGMTWSILIKDKDDSSDKIKDRKPDLELREHQLKKLKQGILLRKIQKLAVMVTNSFQAIRKAFSLSNTLERLKSSFTNIFSMLMKQADQLPAKLLDALRPISRIMLSQILPSVFNGMQAILENFKPIFLNQIIFQIYLI